MHCNEKNWLLLTSFPYKDKLCCAPKLMIPLLQLSEPFIGLGDTYSVQRPFPTNTRDLFLPILQPMQPMPLSPMDANTKAPQHKPPLICSDIYWPSPASLSRSKTILWIGSWCPLLQLTLSVTSSFCSGKSSIVGYLCQCLIWSRLKSTWQ